MAPPMARLRCLDIIFLITFALPMLSIAFAESMNEGHGYASIAPAKHLIRRMDPGQGLYGLNDYNKRLEAHGRYVAAYHRGEHSRGNDILNNKPLPGYNFYGEPDRLNPGKNFYQLDWLPGYDYYGNRYATDKEPLRPIPEVAPSKGAKYSTGPIGEPYSTAATQDERFRAANPTMLFPSGRLTEEPEEQSPDEDAASWSPNKQSGWTSQSDQGAEDPRFADSRRNSASFASARQQGLYMLQNTRGKKRQRSSSAAGVGYVNRFDLPAPPPEESFGNAGPPDSRYHNRRPVPGPPRMNDNHRDYRSTSGSSGAYDSGSAYQPSVDPVPEFSALALVSSNQRSSTGDSHRTSGSRGSARDRQYSTDGDRYRSNDRQYDSDGGRRRSNRRPHDSDGRRYRSDSRQYSSDDQHRSSGSSRRPASRSPESGPPAFGTGPTGAFRVAYEQNESGNRMTASVHFPHMRDPDARGPSHLDNQGLTYEVRARPNPDYRPSGGSRGLPRRIGPPM